MIDSSISGLLPLDVSGAANVTLTFTNGSPSQTDNAIFVFSGVLSGNIDILFPNGKTKLFMVKNSTTGAFTLSLGANSTGSPGTPAGSIVGVPQGSTGMFYSDGTNVFSAFPTTFVNPTFTGTATMPDGSTWTASGLANLVKLGIGISPSHLLDISGADGQIRLVGTGAASFIRMGNVGGEFAFLGDAQDVLGGGFNANDLALKAVTDLYLSCGASGAVTIFLKGTSEISRFGTDGSFLVGSTTNAGAGAIGAVGNITAFYSDERLKTRIGPVTGALKKVMALSAFYYHANELARDLSKGIYDPSIREVGLSAQEVEAVLPEVVAPAPFNHDYKTLRYERIVTLLVASTQEQQRQIFWLRVAAFGLAIAVATSFIWK